MQTSNPCTRTIVNVIIYARNPLDSEPEEGPPVPPVGGGSRMLRGLMLRRRAVLGTPKCEKSVGRRGSAPNPGGELTVLPQTL